MDPSVGRSTERVGFRLGCLVWIIVTTAVLVSPCIYIGAVLYKDGILDEAPSLPEFARPRGATQLARMTEPCDMTEDFGPSWRVILFGTDRSYEDIHEELVAEFEERGWGLYYATGLSASAPDNGLYIHYSTGEYALSRFRLKYDRDEHVESYSTYVLVAVGDCDI